MAVQIVVWSNPTFKELGNRRRKVYPVTCTGCKHTRYLQASDARKAESKGKDAMCGKCQLDAARKSAVETLIERYGIDFLVNIVQKYRLKNPSSWELKIAGILTRLNLEYEREIIVQVSENTKGIIDFKVTGYQFTQDLYIEVDGWQHDNRPEIAIRDEAKNKWALDNGLILIRVKNLDTAEATIKKGIELAKHVPYAELPFDESLPFDKEPAF